ncbi:hypothetical protein BDD12DRAFT_859353 [Trichophaea hybrida]|nr:hypothetical protein BDD12DRAFT_859353 [Trichophaea hybrida]
MIVTCLVIEDLALFAASPLCHPQHLSFAYGRVGVFYLGSISRLTQLTVACMHYTLQL